MGRNADMRKLELQVDARIKEMLEAVAKQEDRSVASLVRLFIRRELEGRDMAVGENVENYEPSAPKAEGR